MGEPLVMGKQYLRQLDRLINVGRILGINETRECAGLATRKQMAKKFGVGITRYDRTPTTFAGQVPRPYPHARLAFALFVVPGVEDLQSGPQ
ncbi:hypothetical protein EXIGLDRAFT_729268 [Exidia glandulosa HHB12029]|uniref:Uncharacterized protein n=1 Tax=Exidia glandulosa HHB12029 TaxID=1314781 RepID=A0A165CP59_EXIGL|nr:hypothetical protein EXIGLDRAFT_729268 [Exidia glandulosa HHB12029]